MDCFVVLQLSSVARHVGRFKQVSKPTQLYIRLNIIPLSQLAIYVSSGIIRHYVIAFVCLHFALQDTRVLNSLEELCITRVAAVNSFARMLNPRWGSVYIDIHWQTVSLYHNSSVWLNAKDSSNWDQNLPNFTLGLVYIYIYIYIALCVIKQIVSKIRLLFRQGLEYTDYSLLRVRHCFTPQKRSVKVRNLELWEVKSISSP